MSGTAFRTRRAPVVGATTVALVVLAVALAWGTIAGVASGSSPAPSSSPGALTLRIGWTTEPDNLNPFIGLTNPNYEIWAMNYDFLFGYGLENEPTLDLAREFPTKENGGLSADGKVWTIHLRPNVMWQDGQPLTADDVAFTYNYVVDNHMANMAVATVGIVGAEALDDLTVRITCSRPKADMMRIFLPILPKHIWGKVPPKKAQTNYVNATPIVGTGPFQTVEFKKGGYIHLRAYKGYWRGAPHIDDVYFLLYQNADTMTADFKSGAIDAAWGIPPAQFRSLESMAGTQAVAYVMFNWDYLNFNCFTGPSSLGDPVLRDWRFRNALNYAVDRERLARIAFNGYAEQGTTVLPPDQWFDPDYHWQPAATALYTFDPAKANQLLDAAGYPRGANGIRTNRGVPISLRLWVPTESTPEQIETKLIASWLKQLGLQIKFQVLDTGALEDRVWNFKGATYAPDFDLYVWDWAGYSDPGQTMSSFTTPQIGNMNESCWSNARFDALNQVQAAQLDPQSRKDTIWRMQQIMYEQTPWVVLTYPDYFEAYNTAKWTGWTQIMNGQGPAFNTTGNVDTYLKLQPAATSSSGGARGVVITIAVAVVAILIVAAIFVLRRRRGPAAEEV